MMLEIKDPMVVAMDSTAVIFVSREDALTVPIDIFVNAQLYEPKDDTFSPVLRLGSFGKFLYSIEMVSPPVPFDRDQLRREVKV